MQNGKMELRFLFSAHCLMMFNVFTKFYENIPNGSIVIKRAQFVTTDGRTDGQTNNNGKSICLPQTGKS